MRNLTLVLASALVVAAGGCIVHGHPHHVSAGVSVGHACDHHYLFYPDYDAYHCGSCGFWWTFSGGAWVEYRTRPSHIHSSPDVVVIEVDERGPEPWVHREAHLRKVPPGWKGGDHGRGPPLGRGRK